MGLGKLVSFKSRMFYSKMFFLLVLVPLLFLQFRRADKCSAECFYVTGAMSADLSTEQTMSFDITGSVNRFSYRYFYPAQYAYRTNIQENSSHFLSFSVEPTTQQQGIDEFGNSYTDLFWDSLSNTTLDITITQQATTRAILDPLTSSDPFPLNQAVIPKEAQGYMTGTALVQSTDRQIKNKADELVAGCTYQFQAVENIIKWIMDNIEYGSISAYDALSTLTKKKGVCTNFAHLACAMLRAEGIPARYVTGTSMARFYSWKVGNTTYSSTWNTGSHAWVEVYYPELGWIPYDAQRDIHHVDVFRMKEAQGRDNHDLSSTSWTYYYSAPSIVQTENLKAAEIKNETVAINCLRKTDEIAAGNYALSLDVIPGAIQPLSFPVLSALNSPTNQKVITVMGTAKPASTVEVFVNGRSAGATAANQTGNFSLSGVSLIEGNNMITAKATLGGLASEQSPARVVVLETQSPIASSNTKPVSNLGNTGNTSASSTGASSTSNAGRQATSYNPVIGYGVTANPSSIYTSTYTSTYNPAASFSYGTSLGGTGMGSGVYSPAVNYNYAGLSGSPFAASSTPYSSAGIFGYGAGIGGGAGLSGAGYSPVVNYNYAGLSSSSPAAYSNIPYSGLAYSPTTSFGYGTGLVGGGFGSVSPGYSFTNSFGYGTGLGGIGLGGAGLSTGLFSPVVNYGYTGLSSLSNAAYNSASIPTISLSSNSLCYGLGGSSFPVVFAPMF